MSATASRLRSLNRRALSLTLDEAIGAINRHSENLDYLKAQQDTLKAQADTLTERVNTDLPLQIATSTAVLRRGFWGRLTWIARGR